MHGQGVFATERIPAGTLVCVYRGELISSEEADRRSRARPPGAPVFVFEIDENFCIDATDTGTENPARFINHACDENCETAWNPRERRLEIRALDRLRFRTRRIFRAPLPLREKRLRRLHRRAPASPGAATQTRRRAPRENAARRERRKICLTNAPFPEKMQLLFRAVAQSG